MSELGYLKAALLGTIQGATEFLPISSSAHLALTERWLRLDAQSPQMLLFNVLAHLGTLLAVAIVFAAPARRFFHRLCREANASWSGPRYAWRIVLLASLATVPTGAIGVSLKDTFEAAFGNPFWIAIYLFITGSLLAGVGKLDRGRRGWKDFSAWQAVLIGIVQGLAILPGISRSGTTICVALFCGLRRRWAAEFSFLIAVPAILGAAGLKLIDTFELPPEKLATIHWPPLMVGSLLALFVGVLALRLLLGAVRRAKLHYFAPYCWILGAVVLAVSR